MLVISGIFLFTFRDTGYLENLIKGISSNLLKGIWDTFLFTSRDMGYWYPPPCYSSLIKQLGKRFHFVYEVVSLQLAPSTHGLVTDKQVNVHIGNILKDFENASPRLNPLFHKS